MRCSGERAYFIFLSFPFRCVEPRPFRRRFQWRRSGRTCPLVSASATAAAAAGTAVVVVVVVIRARPFGAQVGVSWSFVHAGLRRFGAQVPLERGLAFDWHPAQRTNQHDAFRSLL